MDFISTLYFPIAITLLIIWDLVWRLIALWKSAQKGQMVWFVFIGIIGSVGILPIIYLIIEKYKKE